jgi:hypothetical protein
MKQPMSDPSWESVGLANYVSDAMIGSRWRQVADNLIAAARLLEGSIQAWWKAMRAESHDEATELPAFDFHGIYFMLIAYALENYFKAYLVERHASEWRQQVKASGKLPNDLKTHNLVGLAQKAGFTLSLLEEDLLQRLERSSTWFGRYPIPLSARELRPRRYSDGKAHTLSWFGGSDLNLCGHSSSVLPMLRNEYAVEHCSAVPSDWRLTVHEL